MVDDIMFSHFVAAAGDEPAPIAEAFDVGDDDRYIWKAPVYTSAGTSPVTVELLNPETGRLAWVPADTWTTGNDVTEFEATSVTFTGCPNREIAYLGGVLLNGSTACMSLRVSRDDAHLTSLQVPIGQVRRRPCSDHDRPPD